MKIRTRKIGSFTLVEVLIASTIFTILSILATNVFVSVVRIQNRIILENQIYEDARFMMERLAREVRNNIIDYEEYYRETCLEDALCAASTQYKTFGSQIGCYAQQFYNPGTPASLGAVCNDGVTPANSTCIVSKASLDINTGQNPYAAPLSDPTDANAVCDSIDRPNAPAGINCDDPALHEQDDLFLISADGSVKTYISLQKVNDNPNEYATAMIKMFGTDSTGDGVVNQWYSPTTYQCITGFNCNPVLFPYFRPVPPSATYKTVEQSLDLPLYAFKGLVPITPLRTNVTSLKFYIAPLEDPRKAFAETDPADGILQQPHVTIVMTVQPSDAELRNFIGEDPPTVTLQSTVTSRVYREVKTYTGTNVCP